MHVIIMHACSDRKIREGGGRREGVGREGEGVGEGEGGLPPLCALYTCMWTFTPCGSLNRSKGPMDFSVSSK